jgi:inosine-uridine nucleoside N-ribohydrolase
MHEACMPCCADVVQGRAAPLMRPAQQCPEIHGETGLDFDDGSSMQDYAVGHALPGKAANIMFERISAHHRSRWPPNQTHTTTQSCALQL